MDPTLIPSDGSAAERPEETGGGLALNPPRRSHPQSDWMPS